MADSTFNPDVFLDTVYEEAPPDHYTPIDEGEYPLRVKEVQVRSGVNQTTQIPFHVADVLMVVEDDGVKAALNMPEPTARYSAFLDIVDGMLDTGTNKNVKIGQLRTACGLPEGKKWSLRHLEGATCYGKIKQEADRNDPERIYSRVVSVTRKPTTLSRDRRAA